MQKEISIDWLVFEILLKDGESEEKKNKYDYYLNNSAEGWKEFFDFRLDKNQEGEWVISYVDPCSLTKRKIILLEQILTSSYYVKKINKLKTKLAAEKEAHQNYPVHQLSFRRLKYPDLFAELEKRVGKESITPTTWIDDLIQLLQWKEQKSRFEKQEIELHKKGQVKRNRYLNSKYEKQTENVKNLLDIRKGLAEKLNEEKTNHQTTQTNYQNTFIALGQEKKQARHAATTLKNRALELKNQTQSLQNTITTLNNTITTAQTHLGITDLNTLPTLPTGKTLSDLINFFNNPPLCLNPQHNDYDTIKQERNNYKSQSDHCVRSHSDYDIISTERDQLKAHQCDCDSKIADKEKTIITQIITECQLGLNPNSVLEAVITRIKELINKDPDSQTITNLQQQLQNKDKLITDLSTPSEEIKEQLAKLSQELGLSDQVQQSLQSASSYQELVSKQNQLFSEKIQSEIKQKQSAQNLSIGLGVLSGVSLLTLAWLLINLRVRKGKNKLK